MYAPPTWSRWRLEDASLPQSNAEQTPEGEVLRRVTFNPVARPTLRLTPQTGAWDWSQSGVMSLRMQSAMNWAVTLYVTIQSNDGKTLVSRVDLPAGPAQTLLVPLQPTSPLSQGMKAGPPMPMTVDGQRILLASSAGELRSPPGGVGERCRWINRKLPRASCWSALACRMARPSPKPCMAVWSMLRPVDPGQMA